jgi:hypothetical protein
MQEMIFVRLDVRLVRTAFVEGFRWYVHWIPAFESISHLFNISFYYPRVRGEVVWPQKYHVELCATFHGVENCVLIGAHPHRHCSLRTECFYFGILEREELSL